MNSFIFPITFCLLLYFVGTLASEEEEKTCEAAATCKACLDTAGICKWCAQPDYTKKVQTRPRCSLINKLLQNGCDEKFIDINDGKSREVPIDFGPTTQVKPKKVTLTLRPGQSQSFDLTVKPAKNYPVRLYYLMDMSNSMEDDLSKLATLGKDIADEIRKLTSNFQLAFGTFVDKTVTPFIQLKSKDEPPCTGCVPTFGYQHVFNFNTDATEFESAVKAQKISGNLDTPEGGFDALMQVAVCGDKIWPAEKFARKIVVFVTDATPHIAGDGKIGGITVPNDGQCHLSGKNGNLIYSQTNDMDYPSVSLLKAKMKENKIVPIIAVTKDVEPIYKKLQEEWKDLGTGLGRLENDSSNIVQLIKQNYERISSTVRVVDDSPANLVVEYKVVEGCKNVEKDNECIGVKIGDEVKFKVDVKTTKCPEEWKTGDAFKISVPGFGDLEVDVNYLCECNCDNQGGEKKSDKCNGKGTFKCGICYCDPGRFGKTCECDSESQADTRNCIMPNATNKAICSGFGTCVCGKCECNKEEDKTKIISGTYCQCNNFGCDRYNGKICGGKERGTCKCGKCVCAKEFQGENCGQKNCTLGKKECISADGQICSGNGECDCDTCRCHIGYSGKHCEKCVSCAKVCENNEKCVLCHTPYNKGEKEDCGKCKLNIVLINDTIDPDKYGEKKCSVYLNETCRVYFSFDAVSVLNETVYVEEKPRCIVVIAGDAPILIIVLGIIGGIVLVGLLLLLAWKLIVTAYDQHEYHKFEKDRMKSKWENAENPIYRPSKQQFQNPAYAGNK